MVWCGWDKKLWLSTSLNLEAWEPPRLLLVGKWVPCPLHGGFQGLGSDMSLPCTCCLCTMHAPWPLSGSGCPEGDAQAVRTLDFSTSRVSATPGSAHAAHMHVSMPEPSQRHQATSA